MMIPLGDIEELDGRIDVFKISLLRYLPPETVVLLLVKGNRNSKQLPKTYLFEIPKLALHSIVSSKYIFGTRRFPKMSIVS